MTASQPAFAAGGATPFVPPDPSIERLREAAQRCRGCELYQDATQAVMGDGPRDAVVMLIGEQPGDMEDRAGEPFVGPTGKLLDRALDEAGIPPQSVFRTNAVKHFRFSGTRGKRRVHASPDRVHVMACQPWLEAELKLVTPQGVVLLGATAGKALLGPTFKVTRRGGSCSRGRTYPLATRHRFGCCPRRTPPPYSGPPTGTPPTKGWSPTCRSPRQK